MTINSNSLDFCFLNRGVSRNNLGFIGEIDVESTVETGKSEKRVHLHSLIRVKHRTKLQVDLRKTHAFFSFCIIL